MPNVYIVEFLLHISRNSEARKKYAEDPDQAMQDFGLNEKQRKAVKSNDPQQLEEHIVFEVGAAVATSDTALSMTTKTVQKM